MTWHYRVLRHPDGSLALHEVFCDEAGRPDRYTEQSISFSVDADEGLGDLIAMLHTAAADAISRPILDTSEICVEHDPKPNMS